MNFTSSHGKTLIVGLILASMFLSSIALGEESSKASKNLVLVYMVGSDLESEGGAASQNLLQMVNATENRAPEDLQVIVAYGGANKPGWEGLRIATIEDIKEDFEQASAAIFANELVN